MIYFWLKLIHVISSTLLFGTGLGIAFFMWQAHRTNSTEVLAKTAHSVVLADFVFTTPAVIVQLITGFALMWVRHYPWDTPWLLASLGLFVFVGCCWLPVVWIQLKIAKMAAKAHRNQQNIFEQPQYHRLYRIWFLLGWPAFLAVLLIFYLMIFKHF